MSRSVPSLRRTEILVRETRNLKPHGRDPLLAVITATGDLEKDEVGPLLVEVDLPDNLTPDDLFSHLLMLQKADKRLVILVEGDTDYGIVETLVDVTTTNLIPGHSKRTAQGAVELAYEFDMGKVIAILDRDWLGLLDDPSKGNVFYTDQ